MVFHPNSSARRSCARSTDSPGTSLLRLGGEGSWSNTPTVTYQPVMGDRFTQSLLQSVPPAAVIQLIQGSWPV
ncbi:MULTISPECIES: hypothetical protein [Roseateles]|uniref:Uncharacterized protein n=1 Tax=Roseateles albus TaxID=2987525 RepID=A0ABT5KHA6_9BURK|nr:MULTISPECIES: hypothetical protein [Roseateles]MCV2354279.1 hypothetical protein [Paucibacter sp. B2R-40]MDC8772924.1 hypothetical protein [Roseateles albus]